MRITNYFDLWTLAVFEGNIGPGVVGTVYKIGFWAPPNKNPGYAPVNPSIIKLSIPENENLTVMKKTTAFFKTPWLWQTSLRRFPTVSGTKTQVFWRRYDLYAINSRNYTLFL